MAHDVPEPCKFPSLDSYQKFLWTHKEVDLAPHPAVGLVLQIGDTVKLPHAHSSEMLDSFLRVSKHAPCFTAAVEEDGVYKRFVELELACKADGIAPPGPNPDPMR